MTNLVGDFQTDLAMNDAFAACTDAIRGLRWRLESVEPGRLVAYANSASTKYPPKIEVRLTETGSGRSTDVRIVGTDSDLHPSPESALIEELDRVRDAIKACVEKASSAFTAQGDEKKGSQDVLKPAARRRNLLERVREADGELTMPVSELLAEFGFPEFTPNALDTLRALLRTVQIRTTPELDQISPGDPVRLRLEHASPNGERGVGREALTVTAPRPSPEQIEANRRLREVAPELREAAPGVEEAPPEPKTERLANIALALSLVWLFGVGSLSGILLGGIAQRRIDQSAEPLRGRERATAAIILGAIGAIAAIAVIIAIKSPSSSGA